MTSAKIPDYFESIDLHDIRSEASAINVMSITGILDDFLGEDRMVQTVSGRMGSGNFEFYVSDYQKSEPIEKKPLIQVQNSQVEIDGGFENENVFTLIEGKNVVHSNFLIRQLYYPARLWAEKIHKPIRPVLWCIRIIFSACWNMNLRTCATTIRCGWCRSKITA